MAIWDGEWYHRKGVSEDWKSNSIWQQAEKRSQGIVKNDEAKAENLVTKCRVDWTNKQKIYYSQIILNGSNKKTPFHISGSVQWALERWTGKILQWINKAR